VSTFSAVEVGVAAPYWLGAAVRLYVALRVNCPRP